MLLRLPSVYVCVCMCVCVQGICVCACASIEYMFQHVLKVSLFDEEILSAFMLSIFAALLPFLLTSLLGQ